MHDHSLMRRAALVFCLMAMVFAFDHWSLVNIISGRQARIETELDYMAGLARATKVDGEKLWQVVRPEEIPGNIKKRGMK